MKKMIIGSALALLAAMAVSPASADTIFDIAPNYAGGDCVFNTTCGPQFTGNTFAAQQFSLASTTSITNGSFSVYTNSQAEPSAVNWLFLAADGAGGLPGTLLFSGNSAITSRSVIGSGFGYDIVRNAFDVSGVSLGAGNYYFGFQAVSTEFAVYLAYADGSGAAQSNDGGASWAFGYQSTDAVATSLSGATAAVPEPATWAMMIGGFSLAGAAMRRRKAVVSFA